MGTYTANKNLYMPTVGETGWGTLMNGNLETIDNFLKPITVSGSTYTFTGNQTGGSVSATSISNSGTLTNTGKITANGGLAGGAISGTTGTFSGAVTASEFVQTSTATTTVTPNSTNIMNIGNNDTLYWVCVLPPLKGVMYTGNVRFRNSYIYSGVGSDITLTYNDTLNSTEKTITLIKSTTTDLSLSNAPCLYVKGTSKHSAFVCGFTLS